MRPHAVLRLLLSPLYDGALAPEHRSDLLKSGLHTETIRMHRLMSIPPDLIHVLSGLRSTQLSAVRSAMLIPYPDPAGRFRLDVIRMKIFPAVTDKRGHQIKYLQPKDSRAYVFFPLATLTRALESQQPLWCIEGEKKSLAVAQLGLPALGFGGIHAWHVAGSRALLPDFDVIPLRGRVVEVVPDGDFRTNPDVRSGAEAFTDALADRGAEPRIVMLPQAPVA